MKVRLVWFIAASTLCSIPLIGQTNTFPSSGNVGIGTTSPGRLLVVGGSTQYSEMSLKSSASSGAPGGSTLYFGNSTSDSAGWLNYDHALNALSIRVNEAESVRITSDGAVGIGTSSPLGRLQVGYGRPIIMSANGGNGIYGEHAGFNMTVDTSVVPNTVTKLGGTGQQGGTILTVDYTGNLGIQTYNAGTESASTIAYSPQFRIGNTGNVSIGTGTAYDRLNLGGAEMIENGFSGPDAETGYRLKFYDNGGVLNDAGIGLDGAAAGNEVMWFNALGGFYFNAGTGGKKVTITTAGNVGIGTTSPAYPLSVNGTIRAKEVIVDTGWSDYVFEDNYHAASLEETAAYIKTHRHLPDIPSAAEVASKGISVGEMQAKLLAKIEEMTLRQIDQEKQLRRQAERIARLETENNLLRSTHEIIP